MFQTYNHNGKRIYYNIGHIGTTFVTQFASAIKIKRYRKYILFGEWIETYKLDGVIKTYFGNFESKQSYDPEYWTATLKDFIETVEKESKND